MSRRYLSIITTLAILISLSLILSYISLVSYGFKDTVYVIRIYGDIDAGVSDFVSRMFNSYRHNAIVFIITLNTNGGYLTATEELVDLIMNSPVRVIVFIPPGARAFSAGAYIALSADTLVMSPGSVIGSAEPKYIGGLPTGGKVLNAMTGWIISIAEARGRNTTAAELMVRENLDLTAYEAYKYKICDYTVNSLDELIRRENLEGYRIEYLTPDVRAKFISLICNPFIAGLLMELAALLILVELFHPTYLGSIVAGAALILALLGLDILKASIVAIVLLILGVATILLEFKTGHGALATAGAVLIIFAIMLLYRREYFIWSIEYTSLLIGGIALIAVLAGIAAIYLHKIKVVLMKKESLLDISRLVGMIGVAKSKIEPGKPGVVLVASDLWTAYSDRVIEEGAKVRVVKIEGLKLYVEPIEEG